MKIDAICKNVVTSEESDYIHTAVFQELFHGAVRGRTNGYEKKPYAAIELFYNGEIRPKLCLAGAGLFLHRSLAMKLHGLPYVDLVPVHPKGVYYPQIRHSSDVSEFSYHLERRGDDLVSNWIIENSQPPSADEDFGLYEVVVPLLSTLSHEQQDDRDVRILKAGSTIFEEEIRTSSQIHQTYPVTRGSGWKFFRQDIFELIKEYASDPRLVRHIGFTVA